MSENVPTILYDGFATASGGVNFGQDPSVASSEDPQGLGRDQMSAAINCTFRGGVGVTHRPPYVQRVLQFQSLDVGVSFSTNRFQGAATHQALRSSILASVGGRLWNIKVEEGFQTVDVTAKQGPTTAPLAYFTQAGPFTVVADGSSLPTFFDGTSSVVSRGVAGNPPQMRPGTVMAYSQGRIWYAVKDLYGRATRFRATDLINGPLGTARYQLADSVLNETENTFLNEEGDFIVPANLGEIRAMVAPQLPDTSLGQGPLQVFCERGAVSVNAPTDRTTWKDVTYPIETVSQFEYGALGARHATPVNDDTLFRSLDGVRSYKLARADFQRWLNTPVSREVGPILDGDNPPFLEVGSSVLFDNRYLATVWGRPTQVGYVHDGLVALDFDLVSTLRTRLPAAWEGLWTGLSTLQLVKGVFAGVERCFMFVQNAQGRIELWEVMPTATDIFWDNEVQPIEWAFETPAYDFGHPEDVKRLTTAAVWSSDVIERSQVWVAWKPDQYPCYVPWTTFADCAPIIQCGPLADCTYVPNLKPQYRPKVRLSRPDQDCDPITGALYTDAAEFQFRVAVQGHRTIRKIRFACLPKPEPLFDGCPDAVNPACPPLDCCEPNPLLYAPPPVGYSGSQPPSTPGYPQPPPPPVFPGYPDYPPPTPTSPPNPPFVPQPNPNVPHAPPPAPPDVVVPSVNLPGIPPGIPIVPTVRAFPLPCTPTNFAGGWTEDSGIPAPGDFEIGTAVDPTTPEAGLPDGVLEGWAAQLWKQFSDFVVASGITVTDAEIVSAFANADSTRRWFATQAIQADTWVSSFGLGWHLQINYCWHV